MKIVCTESKWFSSIILQMSKLINLNPNYKFKFREEDDNIFNRLKEQTSSYYNAILKFPLENLIIEDYFLMENSLSVNEDNINESLKNNLKVFDLHEYFDAITLTEKFVENLSFLREFDIVSKGKSFTSICIVNEDTQKNYYWNYPDWFDTKIFHSFNEFLVAFIERNICIKYLMTQDNIKTNNMTTIFSLINEQKLNEFFENRNKLSVFLKTEYNSNKDKFFKENDMDKLLREVNNMENFITKTNNAFSKNIKTINNSEVQVRDKKTDLELIKNLFNNLDSKQFIDEMLFSNIDKISPNHLINKKIYESIHINYTNKNAMELINEDWKISQNQRKSNKNRVIRKKRFEKEKSKVKEMQIDSYIKENRNLSEPHKQNKSNEIIEEGKLNTTNLETSSNNLEQNSNNIGDIFTNKDLLMSNYKYDLINNVGVYNLSNDLQKFEIDSLDEKESINKYNSIKKQFLPEKIKKNEIDFEISSEKQNLTKCNLLNENIPKEFLKNILPVSKNNNSEIIKSNNNELQNKLIFQISKPSNNKSNYQTSSPHIIHNHNIIRNLCPFKEENFENNSNNILFNPVFQYNTINGEENTNYSETNETDAASTCISDTQSIKFNFFRRHLFNTPSSDKAIRNKNVNSGNDDDRKSVPTKKSNTNELKEDNLKNFHEKKLNYEEVGFISHANSNAINQITIPEEHSVSRNSNNESCENKLNKKQEIVVNNEISEETNIKKQKKKRHQKFKKNKTQINLKKTCNIELKKTNSDGNDKATTNNYDYFSHSNLKENFSDTSEKPKINYEVSTMNVTCWKKAFAEVNNSKVSILNGETFFESKKLNKSQSQQFYLNTKPSINNSNNINKFTSNCDYNLIPHKIYVNHQWPISKNHFHKEAIKTENKPNNNHLPLYNYPFMYNSNNTYNYIFHNQKSASHVNSFAIDFNNFFRRVSDDIYEYSSSIDEINEKLKIIKEYSINFLQNLLKKEIKTEILFNIYGSFATDLSIESSDIDITIKIIENPKVKTLENIMNIAKVLYDSKLFENVTPIYSASVPIIKIKVDPLKILKISKSDETLEKLLEFKKSDLYKKYKFDEEEISKIKIDLTLSESCNNSSEIVKWVKDQLKSFPEIKPLIHVLKRYLQSKKLNSSFDGGLSSFSLLLLIVAFLKSSKTNLLNIGFYLFKFLEFFGKYFDFTENIIDLTQINPFIKCNGKLDFYPCIIDPITKNNVCKNSFRITEIKEALFVAYDKMSMFKIFFEKNEIFDRNFIKELLMNKI